MTDFRPAKIVGVISFMNAAGAQEALLRLAAQMRKRGHQMEVWFLYQEDDIHMGEPGIRVLAPKPKLSPLEYLTVFVRLVRLLRHERPDAVVGFLPLGNVFGMLAAALAGVPRRIASQRAPGYSFGTVMRALDRILGSTPLYSRIVCVSNAVKDSFSSYPAAYRRKLSVVHNGIDWTPAAEGRLEARRALGLDDDGFLFAAIGRMKTQKNYSFLLEAFSRTQDATLAIAGDGALRETLQAQCVALGIRDRVRFLGALSRDEVRRLLAAADVFVQASLYEGQSNAVLEAMHQGLPVLVSDIPEQRETVLDETSGEEGGLVAPLGDVEGWTEAMERLRCDGDLRARLSASAQAIVRRLFTLERMIDGFETVLTGPEQPRK